MRCFLKHAIASPLRHCCCQTHQTQSSNGFWNGEKRGFFISKKEKRLKWSNRCRSDAATLLTLKRVRCYKRNWASFESIRAKEINLQEGFFHWIAQIKCISWVGFAHCKKHSSMSHSPRLLDIKQLIPNLAPKQKKMAYHGPSFPRGILLV